MTDSSPLASEHRKETDDRRTLLRVQREAGVDVTSQQEDARGQQMFLVVEGTPDLLSDYIEMYFERQNN